MSGSKRINRMFPELSTLLVKALNVLLSSLCDDPIGWTL